MVHARETGRVRRLTQWRWKLASIGCASGRGCKPKLEQPPCCQPRPFVTHISTWSADGQMRHAAAALGKRGGKARAASLAHHSHRAFFAAFLAAFFVGPTFLATFFALRTFFTAGFVNGTK